MINVNHSGKNLRSGILVHLHLAILFSQLRINKDIIKKRILIIIETPVEDEYLLMTGFVKLLDIGI